MIKQNCNIVCRIFAPVLSLILVLGLIAGAAPKAVAADIDDHSIWFDLLDYGAFPDSRSFDVYGSRDFQVPLPYQLGLYYVDVLVQSSGAITSASAGGSSLNNSLSVYSIGNGLYRIQGSLPHVYYDSLRFTLNASYATVVFLSFRVSTLESVVSPETGYIFYNSAIRAEMSSPSNSISYTDSHANTAGFFDVLFNVRYWYKYDAVYIVFSVNASEITSVTASLGDYNLDVNLSYLQFSPDTHGSLYVVAVVDLHGIPNDLPYDLSLKVQGTPSNLYDFTMSLIEVNGWVYLDPPSPLAFWFTSLFSRLGSWFDGVKNTVSTGFSNLANWLSSGFQSVVNKLDELIDGSSDGTSDQIKDDLGSVGDFEDRYHDTVEGNWGDVSGSLDQVVGGSNFIGAASFYSDIVQTIFESVPDYGVVLTAVLCVFVVFSLL